MRRGQERDTIAANTSTLSLAECRYSTVGTPHLLAAIELPPIPPSQIPNPGKPLLPTANHAVILSCLVHMMR